MLLSEKGMGLCVCFLLCPSPVTPIPRRGGRGNMLLVQCVKVVFIGCSTGLCGGYPVLLFYLYMLYVTAGGEGEYFAFQGVIIAVRVFSLLLAC